MNGFICEGVYEKEQLVDFRELISENKMESIQPFFPKHVGTVPAVHRQHPAINDPDDVTAMHA